MEKQRIGIIHPGEMGVSVAASIQQTSHEVYWASAGRSEETRRRAEQHHLIDAGSLAQLCSTCTTLVSVCPPDAAESVAGEVLAHGFRGLYLDANAISPQRVRHIEQMMSRAGADLVDGAIIGGPAWQPDSTWLYLSGRRAQEAAACFAAGPLETSVIGASVGKASALKMCFSAYSKGSTALLAAVLAAADTLEVRAELDQQWSRRDSSAPAQNARRVQDVTAKAWRFAGEMEEIAATFSEAALPGGFHRSAAAVYRRMAEFKGRAQRPPLEEILRALRQNGEENTPD